MQSPFPQIPRPFDTQTPNWQGNTTNVMGGWGLGGGNQSGGNAGGGLGSLMSGPMSGYATYLQGLGWDGAQGTRHDFAQGLRDQGQHPFMDWRRSMNPNMGGAPDGNGAGGGINPGGYDSSGINPGGVFSGGIPSPYGPPHTMQPPMQGQQPMGNMLGGLADLRRRPNQFVTR